MLPKLFPRADYEEDQRFGHTILTIHCLHRGFTAGAFLGALSPNVRAAIAKLRGRPPLSTLPYTSRVLSATASVSLGGTLFLAVGMVARMWGREEIEWQERSWRILVNQGQNREDN